MTKWKKNVCFYYSKVVDGNRVRRYAKTALIGLQILRIHANNLVV
jgi:hypothetical protein